MLYFGSSGWGACQEFNKVLKEYQDETHAKIYYWDATDMKIVRKAAEIKIYKANWHIWFINHISQPHIKVTLI